ncbi:LPD23 domain-containing protein [Prevotellamassilia timonensis]|uniref:MuF-C-terminal domain-containing protein n=1 Tax=Prevotellamassilia timonensis TaxID=1852370 RepID=UPI003077B6A2
MSSESKGAEQSSGVQAEVPQGDVQENAPMPMRVVGKGKNAVQEEDWLATTPKRGHDYVFKESGLDAEEANAFVENKVAEAEKNLEKVKGKAPKMGTNIAAYKEAKADYEARVAEAQKAVDYWHAVKAERDKVLLEERRARKEKDKALYDDAVAQEEQRKAEMAQKAAEQEALGSNAVAPAIKEKWENAPKVDGGADEITLPNGEVVAGHYVLTESGAASASHQATNGFAETEGYPVDVNGETVNDRDYKRDAEAQQVTRGMAADYDSRALQSPVVVSGDGVVLSGNGRTMAGEIAALNGSDAKYNAYLRGHAGKFGFTTEQVEGFKHPRVVFVPDGEMPYTSETFAKFNQREQKSQSRTEMAVKLGKVVDDALFGRVMDVIGRHESLAEFYADDAATAAVVKELADAGVIPQTEMAQLFDGGRLSESGQAMVEGVLVGKVFQGSPDAVRQITEVKSMRKAVMAALPEVVACHRLGGGYDLSKELAAAVDLVYKARKAGFKLGQHVSQHARQGNLFQLDDGATVADYNNAAVMMLADVMNDGRVTQLKKVLSFYNTQAADSAQGIGDMFAGGVKSKGQIINEVNELLNNGQEYDRRTPSVADGQGVGGEGGEQGDVAGPSHQGGAGSERRLSEAFDGLAAQLKTAEGEERKRVLGEMRDGIARFAEENGYPVPEFLLTREDFLAAVPEKDRAKYVEWLDDGWHCPAYYEKGKVYYFVEGCDKFDKDVAETLAHEYTHADNSEFPENVNALTYALEDTHEVTRDELVGILETLSNSSHYGDEAERLESEGKNANPMLADEVIAHAVARMVRDGEQVLDGITNNPTLQFIIKRAYKVRENERRHNILAREASERSSKTIEGSEANSGNGQSVAEGESGLGRYGRSARSEAETGEQSGNGLSAVSDGKEVAAPSLEGAKVGVTDGEKSSATGDVVPSGKGNTPLSEKIATASAEVNTEPTEAQKEAGNYKKGHVQVGTFDITIEQPQGSVRKGTDADGKQWESKMNNTYGYIRGAVGVDGDHIDVFLSNDIDGWNGRKVFVVDQYNPDGSFDEHKVMLGFNDADEAKSDYLANYENGWENDRRIDVTAVNLEDFEKWIASSKRKTKPFGDYSSVKNGVVPSGEGKSVERNEVLEYEKALDHLEDVEQKWGDKIQDYVFEHYPTQATTSAESTSEKGLQERKAMKADPVLKQMYAEAKKEIDAADEMVTQKYSALPEDLRQQKAVGKSAQPPTREESILRDVVIEHMKGSGLDVIGTEDGQRVLDMANDDGAKEHRVYHGSGAEFDHFDHSHMGEGEGAQAYGWGTYVTEVRGIGEGYAIRSKNGISMSREEWSLKRSELESNIYRAKEQLPFLKGEYKAEVEAQILEWEEQLKDYEPHNYLYTVEIPDDNGGNYLDWNGPVPAETIDRITEYLREKYGDEVVNGRWLSNPLLSSKGVDVSARNGAAIYRQLERALGSDKKASQLLSSLGYAGIKYPAEFRSGGRKDDAKNYVIFNENDAEITDHVRFFKTKNGEAYGFTVGGKIYYDPRIANAETPVHEYAHLWASALKANNAKEWKNVVDLMKGTNVWEEVKKTYPELETDDEIADEVLATYSGRRGAERLREEMRKAAAEGDGVMGKAEAVSALQRVKRAIDKFWKAVADFLHIHYTSAEEVADRVMKDLLDGVDPRSMMDGGKSLRPETRVNVVEAEAGHGFKNYAEAKAWAKEHIARTYSGEETGGKGDIRISNAAVDKYLSQSAVDKSESKDVHLAVLKVLPDVIRESVDAEQHADFKKGEDGVRSAANGVNPNVTIHRLYGAVRMDGKVYRVKVTLKEDKTSKEPKVPHSYEATKIELFAGTLGNSDNSLSPNTNNSITAAKLLNGVEKSYDGGKFFEDYNKIREQFIGEKGAAAADHADEVNTRLDNLSVAREMEAEKKDSKAIKMATGWERGADGKWRYEIADMKEFDRNGNLLYRKNHPDYARYIELLDKEDANLFEGGEALTVEERAEFETLSKKYESEKFGGEKLDNNHTLEAYVDAPELFKAYPELKNVGLRFENTGGNEIASYRYISSVFDVDKDDVGEIVVNTGKVSKNTRTREVKSAVLHEMQHAIQEIEGFAGGGSPKSMQKRFEAAKEEWRARAWADALRYKADEMGEHYNQAAVEKALIDEYKEMGMDNDEWMPNKEIRMKGFNYFARGYADRSLDADIKNFRLNESTRADFSPYVEYTRLGGEVESRNVERRMGMSAEERRASLASETEDVSREDQIFLTSGDGGETAHSVEMVHKPSKEETILRDVVIEHMRGKNGLDVIGTEDGQRVLDMANDDGAKEHRVYHGSGAEFDHFDHSHMGEGEGAQAYGWGTYVTEVEGIGRTYAIQNSENAREHYVYSGDTHGLSEERINEILEVFLDAKPSEGHVVSEYNDALDWYSSKRDEYCQSLAKDASLLNPSDISIVMDKTRNLYTVEIPDDNGENYLDWDSKTGKDLVSRLVSTLRADKDLKKAYEGRLSELNKELGKFAPRTLFSDTYVQLAELLGSDKKASQLLSSLGYVGIKYPAEFRSGGRKDGAKNYVIFNEHDAEITDHVRFFKTKNGEAYGFTVGGKIYYDPRIANAETPVHEYAHLWASALKANNAKEWKNVVDLMKGTNVWEEVKKTYPELETDDEIADEVLATYSGRRGAERLREEMRKAAAEGDGVMGKAEAVSALQRVKRAIDKFWKAVADFLHIHYTSAEEVADRVMKDLLDGVDPRKMGNNEKDIRFSAKQKRALETATIADESTNNATVVSSADGAKVQKNLGILADSYKKRPNKAKGFITDLSRSLGLEQHEASQYGTFVTENGKSVTIRVSNHNARVSNFDRNGENDGISIVISSHKNKGLNNDGDAHVTEFFYSKQSLERADSKPLSDIILSVSEALKNGEFNDTTGLAERQEVNGDDVIRFQLIGEKGAAEDYTAFASRYGVSADMVKDYALGMETGNLQKANFALAEIRRTMRVANRGMKLSEFGKLFRPVQKELAERYGDIEVLRQEYIDAEMRERGVMEAARKRAEEEAAKRKARADELRLLPEEELDRRYFEAVERGDDAAAREMLDEAARRKGYGDTESEYQGVGAWVAPSNPGYESDAARRADVEDNAPDVNVEDIALGYSLVDENYWHEPRKYMQTDATAVESVNAINDAMAAIRRGEKDVKVKVYRAVPTSVKEGKLRNGDWVTPSRAYAKMHGEHRLEGDYRIIEDEVPVNELWWDGNDSREWGFDDGKGYKYKNVENSRKLNDLVTRDDNGEIIAPSKRFDENVEDVRYRTSEELDQINQKFNERLDELVSNPNQKDKVLHLGRSSEFLKDGGVSDAEIVLDYDKLVRKSKEGYKHEHPFDISDVRDLPIAIAYPIAVFDNTNGKNDGKVILTELKKDGRNFIVAIQTANLNRKGGKVLEVNKIVTLFPKDARGVVNWFNTGKATNIDKKKALHFIEALLNHSETTITNEELLSAANVVKDFETLQLSASQKAKQQAANDLARQMHVEGEVDVVTSTDGLTGRQAKTKGWYDVRTGKVTIVLPNNKNAADVRETVFHEVVAHKGLRNLVGEEHFNTFLDNVYNNAEEGIKQTIDEMAEKKYNGDKRKATEEYMAHLAEDGEYVKPENQGFFAKVRAFLTDLLRKVGIKLGFKLTDNDLRYILWRSWKGLAERDGGSVFEKAEDVKMQHELGQTDEARSASGENGIMFRDGREELKGIVDKMKADVERVHEGELDDLRSGARAIGGRLSELNKAMRLQRAYDMSTVASVTELAKTMLKNGLLSEMSDYDVRRLLSVVNNVHGKGDIRPYVQKVVDMMVGNRLRNVSKAFDKLLAMRGKKVDARGVEVQGELDLAGQRMADVVWKGIGMSDDDVADMCADAQDRMMSANGAEAAAAATDYAGWQIVMHLGLLPYYNNLHTEYLASYTNTLQLIDCQYFTQCKMLPFLPTHNLHTPHAATRYKHGRRILQHRGAEKSVAPTDYSTSLWRKTHRIRPNRLRGSGVGRVRCMQGRVRYFEIILHS